MNRRGTMETKGRRSHKVLSDAKLQATTLETGKTLHDYLTQQPEKFALALSRVLESANRFSQHKIVYITDKTTGKTHHVGVLHSGHIVDARGRHRSNDSLYDGILGKGILETDLEQVRQLPITVQEQLEEVEGEDELHDELRKLQVFIKHDWLTQSNFYMG